MDLLFCNRKLEKKQRKMYFYDQKQKGKKSGERNLKLSNENGHV